MTHQEAVDSLATERYLLDEMSDVDRDAFEEHYFSCDACAQDVRTASAMGRAAHAVFAADAGPRTNTATISRFERKPAVWYRSAALPWALAASLAGLATYQAVSVDRSARVLHAVTLRPDSRGQEPVVRSTASADEMTLAAEVNGAAEGAELTFEIKDAAGRTVTSGRADAPPAGTPLLLLVPSSVLADSNRYVMSVNDRTTGQSLGTFRFAVAR